MGALWPIGVVMEVFSAISGALAKQLLRHYGKLNEVPDDVDPAIDHHVAAKKVAVWALVLGLFMEFLVGPLLDMAAYGFAPASLIAPLASVQLLVNIIVAPHTLNEERLPGHIISAVVIGVAIVGITIFGHHPEPEFSLELLEALFRSALPDRKLTGCATGMAMRNTVAAQEVDRFLLFRVLFLLAVLSWVFGGGTSATGRSHTWSQSWYDGRRFQRQHVLHQVAGGVDQSDVQCRIYRRCVGGEYLSVHYRGWHRCLRGYERFHGHQGA